MAYFDSSALVKLLLKEAGWDVVRELWALADQRAISRVAYPEVRAALGAAERSSRITVDVLGVVVEDLDKACAATSVVEVDDLLAVFAGELAEQYALRGYDAVHLASALSIDAPRVVVATWDRELSSAASACGCAVVPARP
jgi:uncharacterized protein